MIVTRWPSGKPDTRAGPDEPTPVITMWPAPMVVPPPLAVAITVPVRGCPARIGPSTSRRTRSS